MSNIVSGIAQRRVVGSSARKSVLMLMASCASDDGSGIWTSKANMALDLEMSRRTVQAAIADLIELGIVSETGQRPCKNGYTVEYRINVDVLTCMPCTRAEDAPVQEMRMTRAAAAPLPVQELRTNHPRTIKEPSKDNTRECVDILSAVVRTEVAIGFVEHRKAKKAKLTPHAATLIVKKLRTCPDPEATIERSIMNGWTGVFPETDRNDPSPRNSQRNGFPQGRPDRVDPALEQIARLTGLSQASGHGRG